MKCEVLFFNVCSGLGEAGVCDGGCRGMRAHPNRWQDMGVLFGVHDAVRHNRYSPFHSLSNIMFYMEWVPHQGQ